MPTIGVGRDALFEALGQKFTEDEFQELCFEFGIELDEVCEEEVKQTKTRGAGDAPGALTQVVYKIEIPANRYDVLCLEGLARALNVFRGTVSPPDFALTSPVGQTYTMTVEAPTGAVRPYIVCAVLRNCTFNERSYNSFLDLQDKLHHNICKRRQLVAIGTHDLDKIKPPFRYRAMPPKDIQFVPLAQEKSFNAEELFAYYKTANSPLKNFLHIIENEPNYPVVMDADNRVLSLPPIINGEHSRISPDTKNVLIECTCTDLTKGKIVLNTCIAMFSQYCEKPFTCEAMDVIYPSGPSHPPKVAGTTMTTPILDKKDMSAKVDYIQKAIGLTPEQLPATRIPELLRKMMLEATLSADQKSVSVRAPITRPDVMHACDIMEDVAVAYSFNKIPREPAPVRCTGKQQPLSRLTDLMRLELAQAGFTEALTFALCSHEEAFKKMRRVDDGKQAVVIANPKTIEFQVARTSLLPGLFKTLAKNLQNPLPWRLFEISDTVHLDDSEDVGASNRRRLNVVFSDSSTSGFEIVHGLVERMMGMLGLQPSEYGIRAGSDPTYLDGRCAEIYLTKDGDVVGTFGTVHPEILIAFEIEFPTSSVDIDLEKFLSIGVEGIGEPVATPASLAAGLSSIDISDDASQKDIDYAAELRKFLTGGLHSVTAKMEKDPFKAMQQVLFQASLQDRPTPLTSVTPSSPEVLAYKVKYGLDNTIEDCLFKMKKRLVVGPREGFKFLLSDAGDYFTEWSKTLKARGGDLGLSLTAEELKAKDAADAKAKREKEAKAEAERDAADAENAKRAAALEASGKKATGGLHKFDASEVDAYGGDATADDFLDAFGF